MPGNSTTITQNAYNYLLPFRHASLLWLTFLIFLSPVTTANDNTTPRNSTSISLPTTATRYAPIDIASYNKKLISDANYPEDSANDTATHHLWPVHTVYPKPGALLPFNRIVAYYGNFYSHRMGVLGQYPPDQMLAMLQNEAAKWQAADPATSVVPAIEYIAVSAQKDPGSDGMYRNRMPTSQIDEAIELAKKVAGIVILDIQIGRSNVQAEVEHLASYLAMPNVHLALDPEFSMKGDKTPGKFIGTMDATDINEVTHYLADIVYKNNLPPKILIVHRFTERMVTDRRDIKPLPEVQIVMDMDGWGSKGKKVSAYQDFIFAEPVQFTGFKLFYINDRKAPSTGLLTPAEILKLKPQPLFIMYQ